MKVIFAGFPKTGTKTMKAALTELGFSCYDFVENLEFLEDEWWKILSQGGTIDDFRRMFENVDAVTDIPGCFFWEELHKAFPDAKIIFNQRQSEDVWWKSFEKQLLSHNQPIFKLMHLVSPSFRRAYQWGLLLSRVVFGIDVSVPYFAQAKYNELIAKKSYRSHNSHFLQNAPKDQTLLIDFEQGWQPLCEFLQLPIPDTRFPHKNKNASLADDLLESSALMNRMKREMMIGCGVLSCIFSYGVYKIVKTPIGVPYVMDFAASSVGYVLKLFKLQIY